MNEHEIQIPSEYEDLDKYKNKNGNILYYKKNTNIKHNPYGPAIIDRNGNKYYYINNMCHRLDGPAIVYSDGHGSYFINSLFKGNTKEEFYENFYNDIEYLFEYENITTNKQDKINILNIKNFILNGLDSEAINIINLLL